MSTTKAFDPEVGTGTHDFPLLASTRMFFPEFNYVPEAIFISHDDAPFNSLRTMVIVLIITYPMPQVT